MATAQVLPKELRLSAPPTMPQARSYLFKQQSTQSSYDSSNQVVQINIPRLQRSYLTKDSYLSFRLNSPATAVTSTAQGICFDTPGAFGVIDKIEVYDYLGSTLLESTSGHGQLMALMMDLDTNLSEMGCHYDTMSGTSQVRMFGADIAATTLTADNLVTLNEIKAKNSIPYPTHGYVFAASTGAATNDATMAANSKYEFAIPLFSFLGLLSNKFVPLHNGFTIMITLNPTRLYTGTAGNAFDFTVSNVYMNCQVLELGPTAESMLLSSSNGQPLVVPAKAYRNYKSAVTGGSTNNFRLDLNLNVASLTNVLWIMRKTSNIQTDPHKFRSLSYRSRNNLLSWYFQYGSSILPQTAGIKCKDSVANGGHQEAYIELMKSRHALNSDVITSSITRTSYATDTSTDATTGLLNPNSQHNIGKFAAGIDLELVPGRSQNLICGMNTNGMNTSIYATFDGTATESATVDAWCEYDAFINISPGIASTVSF